MVIYFLVTIVYMNQYFSCYSNKELNIFFVPMSSTQSLSMVNKINPPDWEFNYLL